MLNKPSKILLAGSAALAFTVSAATFAAAETNLRIQTHFAPETPSGKLAGQFVDDVQTELFPNRWAGLKWAIRRYAFAAQQPRIRAPCRSLKFLRKG